MPDHDDDTPARPDGQADELVAPELGELPGTGPELDEAMIDLGGLGDMGGLLQAAMQMQQQLVEAQQQAAATVVEGVAGGGVVRVEVTGGMEFRAVHIAPEAVDPDDVEMLEDLVLAALHDAMAKVGELQSRSMPSLGLPGLDLGGGLGFQGGSS